MKRMLLVFQALLTAAVLLFPTQALAEEGSVLIHVETVDAAEGDTIDVDVMLGDCEGVDSVQFDLNYDSDALAVETATPGGLFAAQYTVTNIDEPGRIRVACASALGLTESGTILTLRFRVLSGAGSAITISSGIVTRIDADYNQSETYVSVENGGVRVDGATLPEPAATLWVPVTPTPTPSPEPTATPVSTQEQAQAQPAATPDAAAAATQQGISEKAMFVIGGLLLLTIVLIIVLSAAKRRKQAQNDEFDNR